MKKPTDIGKNRTGIATSPIDSARLVDEQQRYAPPPGDAQALAAERLLWSTDAPPVGTMPPPATVKGVAKTAFQMIQGHRPTVFLDKLGERLAFGRTGTRLYEALLVKFEAAHVHEG